MSESRIFPRANILGTLVTVSSFEECIGWLARRVAAGEPAVLMAATVYSVMLGRAQPAYQALYNGADYVMADGMPLVWAARLLGYKAERVHGDDLLLACCQRFPRWRHYLLGGSPGQPELVARELTRRFPGLTVAGTTATPVRPLPATEAERVVRDIRATNAQMVWVGMGTPFQDHWLAQMRTATGIPMAGVGSAFDLLAGRKRPTPEWVKRAGLQWLHRLMQDPRRLAGRYLRYNPAFLWHFAFQLWRRPRC